MLTTESGPARIFLNLTFGGLALLITILVAVAFT
jgi:hypothetical protein